MKIEVLISTVNKKSISELNLKDKKIFENCTIINQVTDEKLDLIFEEISEHKIKMISYRNKGLAKSRNIALSIAEGDIILLTDDDISLFDDTLEKIVEEFKRNEDCGILTFKYERDGIIDHKKYKQNEYVHNYKSIRKVCSVEIAIRRSCIIENKMKYNELFGLGAQYNSGEENIFLKECLDRKIKIKFIPLSIVSHPKDSTSVDYFWSEDYIRGKGALFYKLYGKKAYIYILIFIFLKRKRLKKIGILKGIKYSIDEILNFKGILKNEKKV